jgi:hypothetical protein
MTINSETYQLDFAVYGYYIGGSSYSAQYSSGGVANHEGWVQTGIPNEFSTSWTADPIGKDPDGYYSSFIEFVNVDIPKGAIIDSCVIRLTAFSGGYGVSSFISNQYFVKDPDARAPTGYSNFFAKPLTTNTVSYSVPSINSWFAGSEYDIDVTDPFQEIVDQTSWQNGNNVVWMRKNGDVGNNIRYYHVSCTFYIPAIVVNWTIPGGTTQSTKIKAVVKDGQGSLDNFSGEFAFDTNQWKAYSFRFEESQGGSGSQVVFSHADSSAMVYYFDAVKLTYITSDAIQIYPDYEGYKQEAVEKRTAHRTKSGKMFLYKWGDYKRWRIPVSYISKSKATIINSWWGNDNQLSLNITSGSITEANSVQITNKKAPFYQMSSPYVQYFRGTIDLESTTGTKYYGKVLTSLQQMIFTVNPTNTASNQKVIKPDQIALTFSINAATVDIS